MHLQRWRELAPILVCTCMILIDKASGMILEVIRHDCYLHAVIDDDRKKIKASANPDLVSLCTRSEADNFHNGN